MSNYITDIFKSIHAGSLKFRNIGILVLCVVMPMFAAGLTFLIYGMSADRLVKDIATGLEAYFNSGAGILAPLFPLYLILLITLIFYLENSSNTWKKIYALPITKFSVFLEKIFYSQALVLISLLFYFVLLAMGGQLLVLWHPEYFEFSLSAHTTLFNNLSRLFVASFAISAIQFFLSMNWSNIFIPLGVGVMLFISFYILMTGWKYVGYHPYGFIHLSVSKAEVYTVINKFVLSVLVALFFYPLSFILNRRKMYYSKGNH